MTDEGAAQKGAVQEGAAQEGASEVVGTRRTPSRGSQRWMVVAVLCVLGLFVWDLSRGRGGFVVVWWLVYFAVMWGMASRPPTVVTATGVRRPWRLRRFVPWAEVEAVAVTAGYPPRIRLLRTTGRTLTLDDIPADRAGEVAALGGRELRRPVPPPAPRARPVIRVRTDDQLTDEVDRRARVLAEQRAEMAAQAHLRPRGIPRRPPPA